MIGIAYVVPDCPATAGSPDPDGVIIVEDEVSRPHEVEGDHEQPKERAYPYREKRQHGQQPRREVPVGGEPLDAHRCHSAGISGPELAKSVASLRPETTVLYASSYTGDLIERHGISGSAHFIEKPFSFDSLARKVKELLELGKLQKSAA